MSVQITAQIICDDCGAVVSGMVETRSTYAKRAYWSAVNEATKRNWMPLACGQYGTRRHYCNICAASHIAISKIRGAERKSDNGLKRVARLGSQAKCFARFECARIG